MEVANLVEINFEALIAMAMNIKLQNHLLIYSVISLTIMLGQHPMH